MGPKVKDRSSQSQADPLREAFWYRRTFTIRSAIPAIAFLKIAKGKYGTKVFLNGKEVGEHLPCFTPGYFNVKDALKEGRNEIMVRVGAARDAVPSSNPALDRDIVATISNDSIIIGMSAGTSVTNLVATILYKGASLSRHCKGEIDLTL